MICTLRLLSLSPDLEGAWARGEGLICSFSKRPGQVKCTPSRYITLSSQVHSARLPCPLSSFEPAGDMPVEPHRRVLICWYNVLLLLNSKTRSPITRFESHIPRTINKMMPPKRFLRPLVYTTIASGSTYGAYRYFYPRGSTSEEFTVKISSYSSDGKRISVPMTFPLLSPTDVNTKLHENQKSLQFKPLVPPELAKSRAGQVVWHFESAQVAANEVLEDMEPQAKSYPYADAEKGRLLYFAVADGHSGPWTSRFLKQHFINTVAAYMTSTYKSDLESFRKYLLHNQPGVFSLEGESLPASFQLTPETAKKGLQEAFVTLDDGMCQLPFWAEKVMLATSSKQDKPQDGQFPTILNNLRKQYVLPAYSGACGLMTLVDT
jgi:pyruvate dehydrogenase phosphatase